jgi:hypothetical protein
VVPLDVMHHHIQQLHLFSSKNIIQFSWFSPPPDSFPSPAKPVSSISGAQHVLCAACLRALARFASFCLQSLVGFFGVFWSSLLVCRSSRINKKKPVNFALVDSVRVMYSTFPPRPQKKETKQKQKTKRNKTKQKTHEGKRRWREGEEKRTWEENLRRRRRKASCARNFEFRKKDMMHNERSKLLPCKIGGSSLCYIIRSVFQISFRAI